MSWLRTLGVIRSALKEDRARQRQGLRSTEVDFLPAALEVIERPASPTARVTIWILLAGLIITAAWLVFGRVDIVVSAQGKLIPTGNIKIVQSAGSGVVRAVYVRDGDVVSKGQPLVDLDPTLSGADLAQAQKLLLAAELDASRNRAIADALSGKGLHFTPPEGVDPAIAITQRRLIEAQLAEVQANAAGLNSARNSALADAMGANAQVAKLNATVPILDKELANMRRLDAKGYAPGLRLLELERQRRQEAGDRDIASAQRTRGYAEAHKFADQANQTRELARRTALADLAKAEGEAILRREEVTKATQKRQFQRLRSPVSGSVQQLTLHTIGGVVEPARTLMIIVPSQDGVEVEARLINKDIGFVRVGQQVAVKLEAYPFTRYGMIPGTIKKLSRDAIPDQKLGSVYMVTIALDRATIEIEGRQVVLGAGLAATADIRTGTRSIMSYLISPLMTSVAEAGRER